MLSPVKVVGTPMISPAIWSASRGAPGPAPLTEAGGEALDNLVLDDFLVEVLIHPGTRTLVPDEVEVVLVADHHPGVGVGLVVRDHERQPLVAEGVDVVVRRAGLVLRLEDFL